MKGPQPIPIAQRFWPKVDKRGVDECWPWTGARIPQGYGRMGAGSPRRSLATHRVSWELANGATIPSGMIVMHTCDNPSCVNPSHLKLGTTQDNNRDCIAKGRNAFTLRTHCPRGHEYSAENTYLRNGKHRVCRTCGRAATARWLPQKRAADQALHPNDIPISGG